MNEAGDHLLAKGGGTGMLIHDIVKNMSVENKSEMNLNMEVKMNTGTLTSKIKTITTTIVNF